jgi:threonine 3-dehydrogenase
MTRILITGSLGQIGTELTQRLRSKFGKENVIATDIRQDAGDDGPFHILNVLDKEGFSSMIKEQEIDWLVHNASVLSATGERNPHLAMEVNIRGFENAIEQARLNNLRILTPSSIAAFGPSTPQINTPDLTIMRPTTIYGVSKVYLELLGEYYYNKWGVDFRSLRYPGIISSEAPPGGGTTDYAIAIFHDALKHNKYTSFLNADATLPMMYMPDCLKGTIQLLEADEDSLNQRTYNIAGISFNPGELASSIKNHLPEFEINYAPDYRQEIAGTWPKSLDDSHARKDWNWQPDFDLDKMVIDMLDNLSKSLEIPYK